jgi:dTDP-4-dehydrorhamnose reductase
MVVYTKTMRDGDDVSLISANISSPSWLLSSAIKKDGEPFVYVSRTDVFGMPGVYSESSMPRPSSMAGRTMVAMEKNVLSYSNGYVIRISASLDEFMSMVKCASTGGDVPDGGVYPVSEKVVQLAAEAMAEGLIDTRNRILHLVGSKPRFPYAEVHDDIHPVSFQVKTPMLRTEKLLGLYAANLYAINDKEISAALAGRCADL